MLLQSKSIFRNLAERLLRPLRSNLSSVNKRYEPCTGCESPCSKHASYPSEIVQQIDQGDMSNSVKNHRRHLCITQSLAPSRWPKDVKNLPGGYIKQISEVLNTKKNTIGYGVQLTSTFVDTKNASEQTADWYLFPDQLKLSNVNVNQAEAVIEKLFVKDESIIPIKDKTKPNERHHVLPVLSEGIRCERLNGVWMLICCHYQHDQRCGIVGPILIDEIQKYVRHTNSPQNVHCLPISHIAKLEFKV
ncbi:unnamed protein product [Adineta ricciae]|uniref:Uncharacterized protein n=1 Tax=Adineta ricciae TaxID=249248 RepID=A0A813NAC7_ADIRI|nr:unnamed protein product [Adineta ricciae]